jgi:outer membrane protein TolC
MRVRRWIAAVGANILIVTAPGSAQSPAPPAAVPQSASTDGRPVRRLTLDEAVALALDQNLDLQVERLNVPLQDENVGMARGAFVPTFSSDLGYNNTTTPSDSFLSGTQDTLKSDFVQGTAGIEHFLRHAGTSYFFGWDASRSTSNSIFTNFDPRLRSNLRFSLTQPLVRNFQNDSRRTQLTVSRRNREISDIELSGAVVQTVRNVKNAYWDLKAAIANVEVHRQSLHLARQTLRDNQTRVAIGTMAPIDTVEAEAEVARNEEALIVAEATIQQAEDRLRVLVFDPATADFWVMVLEPVDDPRFDAKPVDIDGAVRAALDERTDVRTVEKSLDNVNEQLDFYRNQSMPEVNVQLDYGTTGLGGTQFIRDGGFPGPILAQTVRPILNVVGDVFRATYPTWTLGLVFSYPLGRSNAEAAYARSRLELSQGRLQMKRLELQVTSEIRDAARRVSTNAKRIEAARAFRHFSERRLDAEQKKLTVGLSTSFLVFQAQRDFVTAQVSEVRAVLEYNKSLVDFEALQKAPISGERVVVSGGGSFIATAPGATIATTTTQGQGR